MNALNKRGAKDEMTNDFEKKSNRQSVLSESVFNPQRIIYEWFETKSNKCALASVYHKYK